MNKLTVVNLSKRMREKLESAYSLIKGQFSPAAEDIYQHSMLVAARNNAKGKDLAILKTLIPQSEETLTKSAQENTTLAKLIEQMAEFTEFNFYNKKNGLSA